MNQFLKVFKFEYSGYLKNKIFIVTTVIFAVIIAGAFTLPTVLDLFSEENDSSPGIVDEPAAGEKDTLMICDKTGIFSVAKIEEILNGQYKCVAGDLSVNEIKKQIENNEIKAALYAESEDKVEIYMEKDSMGGGIGYTIGNAAEIVHKLYKMEYYGLTQEQSVEILTPLKIESIETGTGAFTGYMLSYVMVMILYMSIILYGQLVAISIASEKSSRAMELLVTSAKPMNLLFGKILGAGFSGLTQILIMIATGTLFFNINKTALEKNDMVMAIINSLGGPIVYMFVFYILGFFIYAFLFGAVGSLSSRVEDINSSATPIMILLIIGIFVSVPGMLGGDGNIIVVSSFIPFFTPMAMFTRICTGNAAVWEIIVSIVITAGSTFLIGLLSSKIYRLGILMYGNPPKFKELIKLLKQQNKY